MTVAPPQIVEEARKWLGTPFAHQGRVLGVGCDCAGLLFGVARGCGLYYLDVLDYGPMPNPRRMNEVLSEQMEQIPLSVATVGDAYHMAWGRYPQHLAIITDIGIIHAYAGVGRVVEHPLDGQWRGRVRSAYRFRRK